MTGLHQACFDGDLVEKICADVQNSRGVVIAYHGQKHDNFKI